MSVPTHVLDRLTLLAVVTDAEGNVSYTNPLARNSVAIPLGERFSPIARPAHMRIVKSISGATDRFTTAARVDGRTRLVEWTVSPLERGDILYTGLDVTRDRRSLAVLRESARSAKDASQAKMRFLATMSHEMRTPLNGILGMTGLLLGTSLDSNQTTYAEAIRESGQSLLALINDILDFSKIEAGKLELEKHPIDPRALVQSVAELLSPRAAQKGLEISSFVSKDVADRIMGDETRLRQILLNLGSNGVKFTENGGVLFRIDADAPTKDDTQTITISVVDTGIGISEKDRTRIFEEFAQGDDTQTRNHEGTGLGLSIARQLVDVMGGTLEIDSEPGKGSVFRFSISVATETLDSCAMKQPLMPPTVIVASDNEFLADNLSLQLREVGVREILIARSAKDVLRLASKHPGAALLCDIKIAASGEPVAAQCTKSFVLLSPTARGRLESFKRAGFDGYLIKPIRQLSLCERLCGRAKQDRPTRLRLDTHPDTNKKGDNVTYRVLLAEDNQINAVLATAIVKRAGHHIDVAGNGREALEAFEHAHYDIVLMDMRMPEMDGLSAAKALREKGHTDVPIIALTANASADDRDACKIAGMDGFLSKPFDPDELIEKIERLIREGRTSTGHALSQ